MEKYASMWRADSPAERQDEATDLWNDLTGVDRKSNTRERLQSLFPASHSKEASREQMNIYTSMQSDDVPGLPTGSIFNKAFSQEEVDKAKAALIANRRIAESDPTLGERAITGGIGALTGAGIGMLTKGFVEPRHQKRHVAILAGMPAAYHAAVLPHIQRRGIFGMGGMRGGLNLREKMLDERQAQLNKEASYTKEAGGLVQRTADQLALLRKSPDLDKEDKAWRAKHIIQSAMGSRHGLKDADDIPYERGGIANLPKSLRRLEMYAPGNKHRKALDKIEQPKVVPLGSKTKKQLKRMRDIVNFGMAKEAKMTAKQLRDMTIGGAAGLGALGLGIHQVNQSSRNKKGYTPREVRYAGEKAKALRMMELGGATEGQIARHIRRANRKKDKMLDQLGPAGAGLVGAGVGGLSAGLGAKYLLDAVKAGV